MSTVDPKPRRRGRGARRDARNAATTPRLSTTRYRVKPVDVVSADELETIHQASVRLLTEVGIEFRDEVALAQWADAGADVRGERVHLEAELIEELMADAPSSFELTGRGAQTRFEIATDTISFCPMHGAPNVRDLDGVRRFSTLDDLRDINRIVQSSPGFHMASGFACEPMDKPVPWRHLHINHSSFVETDLPVFGMVTGEERARDTVEMAEIVYGPEFIASNVVMLGHISGNSPLVWDSTMLEGLRVLAEAGQGVLLSPFVLGGANTPAHVAATVVQLNAEAIAAIAYAQLVEPGTPVIYGQFSVAVSMRSGAPMSSMPEVGLINGIVGQLARRYGIPWRTTASQAAAKAFDAQSGYESATSYLTGVTANANFMLHAGGWDEAGMVHCLSKLVADSEQNLMMANYARGVSFDHFEEALAAVARVGPGGHYLGDAFTLEHFETAFFSPDILDYEAFENWTAAGARSMPERAAERARAILRDYEAPALDEDRREALDDFVARRETEISPSLA